MAQKIKENIKVVAHNINLTSMTMFIEGVQFRLLNTDLLLPDAAEQCTVLTCVYLNHRRIKIIRGF